MSELEPLDAALAEMARISRRQQALVAAVRKTSMNSPAADPELMRVCRAVGAAVDRLEKERYTRGEIHARRALECQAKALRKLLDRKSEARRGR